MLDAELLVTGTVSPEPVYAALDGGHSLRMYSTVREFMELFLQSPLVTWVSVPASLYHYWCPDSSPATPGVSTDPTHLGPGHPGTWASSKVSKLGVKVLAWGMRGFLLWSPRTRCRTPWSSQPWTEIGPPAPVRVLGCWSQSIYGLRGHLIHVIILLGKSTHSP